MSAFATFYSSFSGDLIAPDHPDYEQSLSRWAANSRRRAAIVAFVRSASDVSLALKYARENDLGVAIRGGGHNPAGASSIEGGLVIDLSRHMNGTKVDEAKKLAFVGGGALWADVNEETMKYGLATTGGSVSHVSPIFPLEMLTLHRRLTLGGGFGYLAGSHGLVIDNLAQATVVVADSRVLTASETENADLFWGIRGGGSNFGVVTEFVLRLHPQRPTIFGGIVMYPAAQLEEIMKIVCEKHEKGRDERESFLVAATFMHDLNYTPACMLLMFWNGDEEEGRKHYRPFLGIEPKLADMTHQMPYPEVNTLLDQITAVGNNYYLKSVDQIRPDIGVAKDVADATYVLSREHSIEITYIFEFWNLKKVNEVPVDATAFQRTPRLSSLAMIKYSKDTPEMLQVVRSAAEKLTKIVTAIEGDENINNGYANYTRDKNAGPDSDAPALVDPNVDGPIATAKAQALFGPHMLRLAELKQKYDPDLVFNKWYAIKPSGVVLAEEDEEPDVS
ncbi:FAD-binding domain-containing protein [Vararia minispora EC-137]|uniref:FAD-binding domain-containing protein n=1 Tax=Vararia minispora EC-137 TaxID=1314806 RepID=A0ACB8QUW9_9AGAM|nr:FAD-binding domain-containing protein [Vararia minispora EC-137]